MLNISFFKSATKLAETKGQQMNLRKERNGYLLFTYKIQDSDMQMRTS